MGHLKIEDKFRSNKLSLKPGGSVVKVCYINGNEFEYDKIKNPHAYISKIVDSDLSIIRTYVDNELYWERD